MKYGLYDFFQLATSSQTCFKNFLIKFLYGCARIWTYLLLNLALNRWILNFWSDQLHTYKLIIWDLLIWYTLLNLVYKYILANPLAKLSLIIYLLTYDSLALLSIHRFFLTSAMRWTWLLLLCYNNLLDMHTQSHSIVTVQQPCTWKKFIDRRIIILIERLQLVGTFIIFN